MSRWRSKAAARVALAYAVLAGSWILITDRLSAEASPAGPARLTIEDAKGLTFVFVTAAGLYLLVAAQDGRQRRAQAELEEVFDETLAGWAAALDLRDRSTADHTKRVTQLTVDLARSVGIQGDELRAIRWGATLHDIGKMGVPDEILRKAGPLTDEEWAQMRRHPELALAFLVGVAHLSDAVDIPYCHHEKWDGSGYPRGLVGAEIPQSARLFAIVDVYDAVTSERPYRGPMTNAEALELIESGRGGHFEPAVVDAFLALAADWAPDQSLHARTGTPGPPEPRHATLDSATS